MTTVRTPSARIRREVGESNSSMSARSRTERLAAAKRFPGDRAVEGNDHLLVDQSFSLREIERHHAHLIRRGIKQREARVFVVNHAAQGRGDGAQEVVQVELGNHGVIYFEQHAQAVALPRQLPLVGLRALEIQRVVHGDGDLPRHLLQERDFALGVLVRRASPETHDAQPALRRGQRQRANRFHAVLAHDLQQRREWRFLFQVIQDERLLRFPDPAGRRLADLEFGPEAGVPGHFGFEDVQAHDVARGIVQDQVQVLEVHHAVQPLRQFVEQLAEIAVLGDRFGHFEQRLMLRLRRSAGQFASGNIAHSLENNTTVRRGSTRDELFEPSETSDISRTIGRSQGRQRSQAFVAQASRRRFRITYMQNLRRDAGATMHPSIGASNSNEKKFRIILKKN